ncbi:MULTISPECIES: MOSC domain-containing protein [unclassified Nocardioides]|uniref:MOSC domain-containing protein n=1 Tax=unclassified Nocardioides TaxID=2615069 RepID=UPI000702AEA6|nr:MULTISPECIES: MOSC domain-containing protein [unclassified Nocardioides]KRC46080.1 sulfurase [Nocardioides sp. Root79]KRC69428.1 sulfurase [Nocardioides sp. Root240]
MTARVLTISVGSPQDKEWAGIGRTSIDKTAVAGRVRVHELGIEGDQVSDTLHHGGPDQAVYAFAREDLDFWERELGRPIRDGQFGENLTTVGIDLNALEIGTRLRVGDEVDGVLLEVVYVRTPCNDFKGWMGESGYDPRAWVKRFAAAARPGPYLRVLETGTIEAGAPIEVVHRPGHGVSVSDMFVALNTDRSRLPELLVIDGLLPKVRMKAEDFVRQVAASLPSVDPVA